MLWLVNSKGEVLLARRADNKSQDPGLWGPSVTGKLESGENFEEAAVREAQEELSLQPGSYSLHELFETDFDHPDGQLRRFKVFATHISDDQAAKLTFDAVEVAEIKWLAVPDVKKLLNSKPGEVVVASAFVLWQKIFDSIEEKGTL